MSESDDKPVRRGFHVYLSPEAYDGWLQASETHRVSMTALAEVFGLWLLSQGENPMLPPDAVDRAVEVDRERRTRRRQ